VHLFASGVTDGKGEEANQDVRGRRDCQEERLVAIGLKFSDFPVSKCTNIFGALGSLHLTSGTE
jgi:hypothetical protein